jgi:hypothetical protein
VPALSRFWSVSFSLLVYVALQVSSFMKSTRGQLGKVYSIAIETLLEITEPQDGLGDGDVSPNWTVPAIDQIKGEAT